MNHLGNHSNLFGLPVLTPVRLKCSEHWHYRPHKPLRVLRGSSCVGLTGPSSWRSNCLNHFPETAAMLQVYHARVTLLRVITGAGWKWYPRSTGGFSYGLAWGLCFCEMNISHSLPRWAAWGFWFLVVLPRWTTAAALDSENSLGLRSETSFYFLFNTSCNCRRRPNGSRWP